MNHACRPSKGSVVAVEDVEVPKTKAELAAEFKQQGNEAYSKGDYYGAIQAFSQAIQNDPSECGPPPPSACHLRPNVRSQPDHVPSSVGDHVFYSNRSACWLNLKKHKSAIADAQDCIRMQPKWPKGYSRLGANAPPFRRCTFSLCSFFFRSLYSTNFDSRWDRL